MLEHLPWYDCSPVDVAQIRCTYSTNQDCSIFIFWRLDRFVIVRFVRYTTTVCIENLHALEYDPFSKKQQRHSLSL
jgi:hypothetical protein